MYFSFEKTSDFTFCEAKNKIINKSAFNICPTINPSIRGILAGA